MKGWPEFVSTKLPQYKPDLCARPREEKDNAVKDAFYANIVDLYDKCLAHDIKIVLGPLPCRRQG